MLEKTKMDPDLHVGVFGSGVAVMANNKVFADGKSCSKLLGQTWKHMRSFSRRKNNKQNKPKALVIKAVQDYADDSKAGLTPEQQA